MSNQCGVLKSHQRLLKCRSTRPLWLISFSNHNIWHRFCELLQILQKFVHLGFFSFFLYIFWVLWNSPVWQFIPFAELSHRATPDWQHSGDRWTPSPTQNTLWVTGKSWSRSQREETFKNQQSASGLNTFLDVSLPKDWSGNASIHWSTAISGKLPTLCPQFTPRCSSVCEVVSTFLESDRVKDGGHERFLWPASSLHL